MATIVSPYNPWREKLAASILGPIISGAITRGQQRADNAYNNKIAGQVMDALTSSGAGTSQVPGNLLGGLSVPQQSNNGWENAFRQNNNELANFDMSMAPIVTAQTAARRPNMSDMQSAFIRTLQGTKADPAAVRAIVDPYMQASIKDDYISQLSSADSWDNYMKTLTNATIAGAADKSVLTPMSGYTQHRQPNQTFSTIDAGDKQIVLAQNPANGSANPVFMTPVGVNPNTALNNDTQRYVTDVNARTIERGQDYNYNIQDRQVTLQEAAQKYQQEHPTHLPITAPDGNIYFYDPGNPNKIVHGIDQNGQPIIDRSVLDRYEYKQDATGTWYLFDKYATAGTSVKDTATGQPIKGANFNKELAAQYIKYAQDRNKNLEATLKDLQMSLGWANEGEKPAIQAQIKAIEKQIADNEAQVQMLIQQYSLGNTTTQPTPQPAQPNPVPALSGDGTDATTTPTENDDLTTEAAPIVTAPTTPAPTKSNNEPWKYAAGLNSPTPVKPGTKSNIGYGPMGTTPPQTPVSKDAELAMPYLSGTVTPDWIIVNKVDT